MLEYICGYTFDKHLEAEDRAEQARIEEQRAEEARIKREKSLIGRIEALFRNIFSWKSKRNK